MLAAGGYVLQYVQPVDMFPETVHVETVCLLSKLSGSKNTIDVKVDMDELDVTSAETKATYEEIKAYVLEQTGLQVSNLYIAQVKRECGIIERENYNKAKSEDSRQPQCPEEKRKAIMEALEHFGMV
jgi:23S rRNA (uracil1939-C5)-methyltransferase